MHRGLDFVCFLSYPTILNEDETAVRFRLETFSATQHHVFKTILVSMVYVSNHHNLGTTAATQI